MNGQDESALQIGFLQDLSQAAQKKLLSLAELFHYDRGEIIFRQDEPSLHLYIIKKGGVAIDVYIHPRGPRRILTLGPGELFSWSAIIEPRHETATARAIENTEVLAIKGGALIDLCLEDSALGCEIYKAIAGVVSSRLKATQLQLLDVFAAS